MKHTLTHYTIRPLLPILTAAICCSMMACTTSSQPTLSDSIDAICSPLFPADEPGAAVLFLTPDTIVTRCYGLADLTTRQPVSDSTAFCIASCSKQFTAIGIMQLASRRIISLADPVCKWFPELTDTIWEDIRLYHLLSHSSGTPDARGYLTREEKIAGTDSLATAYLANVHTLHFQPGTDYEYINPTFVLLGQLIERASGMPFEEYMQREVFSHAGMHHTFYFHPSEPDRIPHMAHGYEYADVTDMPEERTAGTIDGPKNWYEYDYGEETFFATRPDGGIYTSVNELLLWEMYLRRLSQPYCDTMTTGRNQQLDYQEVSAEDMVMSTLLHEAMSPQNRHVDGSTWSDYQNRPGTSYGWGWFIEENDSLAITQSRPCIYHTGDNGGFKILMARYPASQSLIIILAARADWDRYALKTQLESLLPQIEN